MRSVLSLSESYRMEPDLAFGAICVLIIFLPGVIASITLVLAEGLSSMDRVICSSIIVGWIALFIWTIKVYTRMI